MLDAATRPETLEVAFGAWQRARLEHLAAKTRLTEELSRLSHQGSFLLGAVRAASAAPPPLEGSAALARPAALQGFLADAEGKLGLAKAALEGKRTLLKAQHEAMLASLRHDILVL